MAGLQEYKCPCCGGAIAFDSKIQKMKCPYCDTEFEMDALKGYDAEQAVNGRKVKQMVYARMCVSPVEARLSEMPTWQQHPAHSVIIRS